MEDYVMQLMFEEILQSSSESSSEDDSDIDMSSSDEENQARRYVVRAACLDIIQNYSDEEFKEDFRMERATFFIILEHIRPYLEKPEGPGRPNLSSELQFYVSVWCIATPDSYRSVSRKFGISKSVAWRAVEKVCSALYAMRSVFIRWPNAEEAARTWMTIERRFKFPKVLGAIDGTHINIPAPHDQPEAYVNRKGRHSIQLQVVCDNDRKFLHCYCGEVGSVHDQRVYRLSGLTNYMNEEYFPQNSHLIGDSAYQIGKHLLVPYRDNGHLTDDQIFYNTKLSSARMVVERAIGLLKGRWRSLFEHLAINKTENVPKYVIACCVLHNICLMHNDDIEVPLNEEFQPDIPAARNFNQTNIEGLQKRLDITVSLAAYRLQV